MGDETDDQEAFSSGSLCCGLITVPGFVARHPAGRHRHVVHNHDNQGGIFL